MAEYIEREAAFTAIQKKILFVGLTLLVYDGCVLEFTDRLPPDSHGKVEAVIIVVSMVLLLVAVGAKVFGEG